MPPRKKAAEADGIDLKRLMKTWDGRWIWIPFFIAIAVVVGTGLVFTLFQLQGLPPLTHTGPAGLAVLIYYAIEVRKLVRGKGGFEAVLMNRSTGIGKQTASGSAVAPVIRGNNNTVTVIHSSSSAPQNTEEPQGGAIRAGRSIKAGGDIRARDSVEAGESIEAGGSIDAGKRLP